MAIYRKGQASMDAQGYITGYGTTWRETLSLIRPGATVMFATNPVSFAQVTEVVNDTSMRAINTGGKVIPKIDYVILLHDAITVDGLAQDVAETLRYYQGKESEMAHFIEIIKSLDMENLESIVQKVTSEANRAKSEADKAKASQDSAAKSVTAATQQANTAKGHADAAKQQVVLAQNAADFASNQSEISAENASRAIVEAERAVAAAKKAEDLSNSLDSTKLLRKDQNLADLADKAVARRNLGVDNIEQNNEEVRLMTKGKDAWLSLRQSDRKWGMWDGVTKKWVPLGLEQGGTGAADAAGARGNLGLGTAAVKDVGVGAGNVMEVGAFGLGVGSQHKDNALQRAAQFFRANNATTGRPTDTPGGAQLNTATGIAVLPIDGSPNTGYIGVSVGGSAFVGHASNTATAPTWWRIYTTQFKPTKADVGLSNVTNDAQVKKAGDTMSGNLAITKASPAVGLNATGTTAATFRLNNENGSERGSFSALQNGASSGSVTIRAKNSAGAHTGELVVDYTGKISAASSLFSGEIASKTAKVINTNDSDSAGTTVWVKGAQHTPLLLERHTSTGNVSIGFKVSTGSVYRLGVDPNGYLGFGSDANQSANSRVITQRVLDEGVTVNGVTTFNKRVNVNGGVHAALIANDITGQTIDLNNLMLKSDTTDSIRFYQCISEGGGANITNKPSGVKGNFMLRVESMRKVSATDFNNVQTLVTGDTNKIYVRFGGQGGFSVWNEVILSDRNQNLTLNSLSVASTVEAKAALRVGGSIGIGGGNTAITSDKAIVFPKGSTFRETNGGGAVVSSSGGADRRLHLLPAGATSAHNNGVIISATAANGGDTIIEFQQGAKLRSNSAGAAILSSKNQSVFIRPKGDGESAGQMTVAASGDVSINGNTSMTGWLSCNGSFTSKQAVNAPSIELSSGTPFIDFHFNNSGADYTSRIIERSAGVLTFDNTSAVVGGYFDCFGEVIAGRRITNPNPANGTLINGQTFSSISVGRGGYTDQRGMKSMFYCEENVGNIHYAVIGLDGHGRQAYWTFRADGGIKTPQGDVQMVGSDVRIKNSFAAPKEGARDRIMELGVCEFKINGDDRVRRGFIAQQADMVDDVYAYQSAGGKTKDENGNDFEILNIDQTAIMADMVTTIQEQDAEIKELKSELAELRAMVEKLNK